MKQYCEREKRNEERRQVINENQIKQIIKNETKLQVPTNRLKIFLLFFLFIIIITSIF